MQDPKCKQTLQRPRLQHMHNDNTPQTYVDLQSHFLLVMRHTHCGYQINFNKDKK